MKNNNVFLLTIVSCLLFGTLSAMDKQPKSISEKNEPSIALESNAGNSDIQSKSLTCPVCNNPFSTKQSLNRHIETIHNKKKDFICTICKQSFTQKSSLDTHISTVHEGKRFTCEKCERSFSQTSSLYKHIKRMHESKTTSSKGNNSDIQSKSLTCPICKKAIIGSQSNLKIHIRTHTGEKPHKCDQCEKKFAVKNSLTKHILTHTGEKPHKCDDCGKRFAEKSNLTNHILTHTGEKPHKCDQCEKKFADKSNLNRHMLTHTSASSSKRKPASSLDDSSRK